MFEWRYSDRYCDPIIAWFNYPIYPPATTPDQISENDRDTVKVPVAEPVEVAPDKTSSNGVHCYRCNLPNPQGEPNLPDGKYICYNCR